MHPIRTEASWHETNIVIMNYVSLHLQVCCDFACCCIHAKEEKSVNGLLIDNEPTSLWKKKMKRRDYPFFLWRNFESVWFSCFATRFTQFYLIGLAFYLISDDFDYRKRKFDCLSTNYLKCNIPSIYPSSPLHYTFIAWSMNV